MPTTLFLCRPHSHWLSTSSPAAMQPPTIAVPFLSRRVASRCDSTIAFVATPSPFSPSTAVSIAACMTLPASTAAISHYHLSSALLLPSLSVFPSPTSTFVGDTTAALLRFLCRHCCLPAPDAYEPIVLLPHAATKIG
ncbi:hypothetical protein BHM03_00007620 [Ensete ventricosum]|nr:hypothetical protein BHM03_00007620 [Ensete ventricosum]